MASDALVLSQVLTPDAVRSISVFKEEHESLPATQTFEEQSVMTGRFCLFKEVYYLTTGAKVSSTESDQLKNLLPYREVSSLGLSASGGVFLNQHTHKPELLSVSKEFKFEENEDDKLKYKYSIWHRFLQEVGILQDIDCDFIVKYDTSFMNQSHALVFMEFCLYGSLNRHLGKLTLGFIKIWFGQLARAVQYLHQRDIVHRDIKLENVLIRKDMTIALTDFDLSEKLEKGHRLVKDSVGTDGYMAPEVDAADEDTFIDGYKADSFSLGIVLLCMATKRYPAQAKSLMVIDKLPSLSDPQIRFCLCRLLTLNPIKRFDVVSLLNNSVFHSH